MSEEKRPLTLVETSHTAITSLIDHYTMALREQERTFAIERSIMRAKMDAIRTNARDAISFARGCVMGELDYATREQLHEKLKRVAEVVE